MKNKSIRKVLPIILAVVLLFTALPFQFAVSATTVNVLDGQVSVTDTANSNTVSGGTVTIKAKGSLISKKTNTVTVTNETDNKAKISFDYTAENANSFQIAGATVSDSGSYSVVLEAGASLAITLVSNSGFSNTTATLTLSNFSISAVSDKSNVTFNFDSNYGSVTVGGENVSSGTTKEVTSAGATVVASPVDGATFLGFVNAAGEILSESKSYTFVPTADATVKAIFVGEGSAPHFSVGGVSQKSESVGLMGLSKLYYYEVGKTYIFDNLNDAIAFASSSSSSKTIKLLNDSTLPAGNYTIPAGVSVLIPFLYDKNDSTTDNRMYTTEVQSRTYVDKTEAFKAPTTFRKLTLASGVNITVNGALNLSAKQIVANGGKVSGGSPVDSVSMIDMKEGSSITVNNGGKLYAYGFITGKGTVTAKSGADVYECFQMMDFRGGTQATDMEHGVFPISQYYIQNIEVPLTLEYGSREHSYTTVYMSSSKFGSSVEFIGPNDSSMFNLTRGSVTKIYDGSTDRLVIELNGDMQMNPVSLKIGTSTINSEEYVLAVNNNITINVNSGSNININQDIALLPGTELYIKEGATAKLGSGKKVYVYDADQWGNFVFSGTNKRFAAVEYAPGRTYTRTAKDLTDAVIQIDGTVDASAGYVYTTAGAANVYSTGTGNVKVKKGTDNTTYQLVQSTGYSEISITPAKLKNADGTYLATAESAHETNSYKYEDGKWVCVESENTGHTYETVVTEPTCTTDGCTTNTCKVCGHISITDKVPAGHKYDIVVTEPTCTTGGYTTYTCSVCKDSYVDAKTESTGHNYTAVVIEPTCTTDGYTEYTCVNCGDMYTSDKVVTTGHNYELVMTTAPTCLEDGYTTYKCSKCHDSYNETGEKATGHSFSDYEIINKATHSAVGSKIVKCHCGYEETEEIPVIVCDIDGDGITGKAEHLMMRKIVLGLISPEAGTDEFAMIDMNDDGVINLIDYACICRVIELNGIEL